ncbi:hypothetical protein BDV24DRAFT_158561 [Aspergillus arachidicola]|uniref:Uncharacterized protein n=1 Tax=Aspergillus arachidicola TaxID=656916 RepID=A0A5N6YLP8_9EURO|nr:hypothetical protein BDV24DRAFT_158561 [Aspergillus arachidicola]
MRTPSTSIPLSMLDPREPHAANSHRLQFPLGLLFFAPLLLNLLSGFPEPLQFCLLGPSVKLSLVSLLFMLVLILVIIALLGLALYHCGFFFFPDILNSLCCPLPIRELLVLPFLLCSKLATLQLAPDRIRDP